MNDRLPTVIELGPTNGRSPFEDHLQQPALYQSVLLRRCLACCIDWVILCCLFVLGHLATCATSVFTFGALTPLAVVILGMLPIIYGTWTIGGRTNSTPGMRALDLTVRTWQGDRPAFPQALLMTILFYVTVLPFGGLLLLYALFDQRLRCIHDHFAGVIVVRRSALSQARLA